MACDDTIVPSTNDSVDSKQAQCTLARKKQLSATAHGRIVGCVETFTFEMHEACDVCGDEAKGHRTIYLVGQKYGIVLSDTQKTGDRPLKKRLRWKTHKWHSKDDVIQI